VGKSKRIGFEFTPASKSIFKQFGGTNRKKKRKLETAVSSNNHPRDGTHLKTHVKKEKVIKMAATLSREGNWCRLVWKDL